jgi:glycolate oxidase FAD binding subunit
MTDLAVQSIDQLQSLVQTAHRILPYGGGSKPALSDNGQEVTRLDLRALTGILEYEPGEYTFTALAGTPLAEVQAALAENGQSLPFDPPLVDAGATLGGTIATGLSGSGRYRYGGVRDFLIGVRFIDGQGRLVRGGGKVVKNAAGFDLPKLMVGSLGRLGVLVEASFKVFPRPQSYASLRVAYPTLAEALAAMQGVASAGLDIEALDIEVTPNGYSLWVRLGGWEAVLPQRLAQVRRLLTAGDEVSGDAEVATWTRVREFSWAPAEWSLVKVALTATHLPALDQQLAATGAQRHYAVGGNLGWIAWPGAVEALDHLLNAQKLPGLVLRGNIQQPRIGTHNGQDFLARVKQALDPNGKFLEL